jgi:hypothetical protein
MSRKVKNLFANPSTIYSRAIVAYIGRQEQVRIHPADRGPVHYGVGGPRAKLPARRQLTMAYSSSRDWAPPRHPSDDK